MSDTNETLTPVHALDVHASELITVKLIAEITGATMVCTPLHSEFDAPDIITTFEAVNVCPGTVTVHVPAIASLSIFVTVHTLIDANAVQEVAE